MRRASLFATLAHRLELVSGGRLAVSEGALYPALHRLEKSGCLKSDWRETASGRDARFYRLTAKGRRQLEADVEEWRALATAIALVLGM